MRSDVLPVPPEGSQAAASGSGTSTGTDGTGGTGARRQRPAAAPALRERRGEAALVCWERAGVRDAAPRK